MDFRNEGDRPAPEHVDPESLEYDMTGDKLLLVLNNETWTHEFDMNPRIGSDRDVSRLKESFGNIEFNVELCNNFTHQEIMLKLRDTCKSDGRKLSCMAVAVMTYGVRGEVYAADTKYPLSDIIKCLLEEPKLTGIPKLFFIQADVACEGFSVPSGPDCFVLVSSSAGHSYRSEDEGSWLIQALCDVVDTPQEEHPDRDLLHMMMRVINNVASKSPPRHHRDLQKQIPEIRSTLTKLLRISSGGRFFYLR